MQPGATKGDVGGGRLRELIAFDQRIEISDGFGNTTADFVEVFKCAAEKTALHGGESIQASRLEGKQPYLITVRYSPNAILVNTDWRCRDTKTGEGYAITTHVVRPRKDYIDMLCIAGVADAQVA